MGAHDARISGESIYDRSCVVKLVEEVEYIGGHLLGTYEKHACRLRISRPLHILPYTSYTQ